MVRPFTCCLLLAASPLFAEERPIDASSVANQHLDEAISKAREGDFDLFEKLIPLEADELVDRLVTLLEDPDPNVRLGACRALGHSKRVNLAQPIARRLKDTDWRVCNSACLSLIKLEGKDAIPELDALSRSHWYPRVKSTAKYAIHHLQGIEQNEELQMSARAWNLIDRNLHPLPKHAVARLKPSTDNIGFLPWDRSPHWPPDAAIETFRIRHPKLHAAIDEGNNEAKRKGWSYFCRITGLVEKQETSLVGIMAGEWVGGLFAISGEKAIPVISNDDVFALMEWDKRLIAFAGFQHSMTDRGAVYEVAQDAGVWNARYRFALPGCPQTNVGILPDGRLFANCQGGAVAISVDGTFTYLGSGDGRPEE